MNTKFIFNVVQTKQNIQLIRVVSNKRKTLVFLKNNNPYNIEISGKLVFKDHEGIMIGLPVESNFVSVFESAQVIALIFENPDDFYPEHGSIEPVQLTVGDAHKLPSISHVILHTETLGRDGWFVKFETNAEKEISSAHAIEILYDKAGYMIDAFDCIVSLRVPGEIDMHEHWYPEDENGDKIRGASCEILVDSVTFV